MEHIFALLEPKDIAGELLLPGWYFWDETDAHAHGPFNTHEEAEAAMVQYGKDLNPERT